MIVNKLVIDFFCLSVKIYLKCFVPITSNVSDCPLFAALSTYHYRRPILLLKRCEI